MAKCEVHTSTISRTMSFSERIFAFSSSKKAKNGGLGQSKDDL